MQVSKQSRKHNNTIAWLGTFLLLILIVGTSAWINQKAIERYWQQQHHQSSPLVQLEKYPLWKYGNEIYNDFTRALDTNKSNHIATKNDNNPNDTKVTTTTAPIATVTKQVITPKIKLESINHKSIAPPVPLSKHPDKVILTQGDFVVFVGDSMMQSLAPSVQKWLKKEYDINSINMGRHSTGLTNHKYFNWPQKVEQSLSQYKNLKLVVVMLGANDPWGITTRNGSISFRTKNWATAYSNRILRIINEAHRLNAKVIWIGLPYMRLKKYNKNISYINNVMQKTVKDKAIFIPIHNALSNKNSYSPLAQVNNKIVSVRAKDGIHLNHNGNAKVLELIKQNIIYIP